MACLTFEWLHWLRLRKKPGPINRAGLRFLGTSRFVDIRRARQELGYVPRVTLRTGLAAAVTDFATPSTRSMATVAT
jgi:nucleoside-diphosphate-sugar epimerase